MKMENSTSYGSEFSEKDFSKPEPIYSGRTFGLKLPAADSWFWVGESNFQKSTVNLDILIMGCYDWARKFHVLALIITRRNVE